MKILRFWQRKTKAVEPTNDDSLEEETQIPEVVELEITDIFDLHAVPPHQTKAIIEEYLFQAHARGFRFVRIIHGKGIGVQREIARQVLARTPFVLEFLDAPPEAGGWGATIVELQITE